MDTPKPNNRGLSEISHLFLSSVRDKQGNGAARPQRKPPAPAPAAGPNDPTSDLTAEEFFSVAGQPGHADPSAAAPTHPIDAPRAKIAPVSVVIASHLNGKQFDRVKEYARHLASHGQRIGLIEVDASEFRLMCFDRGPRAAEAGEPVSAEVFDPRRMAQAMEELNFDMDRWLVLLPSPRTPEARALLREVESWVMLSTCDPDGVVSCYRTLKGLIEQQKPELSLAVLDAGDESHAASVHQKLAGVCRQFLDRPLRREGMIVKQDDIAEHLVLLCRPTKDKSQVASAPQWGTVAQFLLRARQQNAVNAAKISPVESAEESHVDEVETIEESIEETPSPRRIVADVVVATPSVEEARAHVVPPRVESRVRPAEPIAPKMPQPKIAVSEGIMDQNEVLDLTGNEVTESSILSAIMHRTGSDVVECPLRPPMCPGAALAVNRDRRLVLLAVARQGLADLRSIGLAYRWLNENRGLVAMALPQMSIDSHAMPALRMLVDHADLTAEVLQPILQAGHVTVQAYRALKWGGKTGLLLEAA